MIFCSTFVSRQKWNKEKKSYLCKTKQKRMKETKPHTTPLPNSAPSEELYRFGADGNMRMYSYDRLFFALYGYDGGTTRTYKYSFDLNPNWVNGRLESVNFNLHNAMFYPNSYLNFNSNGYYTKHYYNGMERIASRLGDNNLSLATHDPELQDRKWQLDSNIRRNIVDITGYEFLPVGEEQNPEDPKPVFELPVIGLNNLQPSADGIYYYHSNHLGSTCYVTDDNATVQQGFLYAPFGEITNEYNSSWQSGVLPKYSFNAKELDEETGMYYYEARYMAPPVFISRDPLFEKYPTISPYTYCANNPVKYVDPTGEEIDESTVTDNIRNLVKSNKEFAKVYKQLKDDKTTLFRFNKMDNLDENGASGTLSLEKIGENSPDVVNINYTWDLEKEYGQSAERALCEEVYHAKQFLDGELGLGLYWNGEKNESTMLGYDMFDEKDAIDWSGKITKQPSLWEIPDVFRYYRRKTNNRPRWSAEQEFIKKYGKPAYDNNGVAIGNRGDVSVTFRKPKN